MEKGGGGVGIELRVDGRWLIVVALEVGGGRRVCGGGGGFRGKRGRNALGGGEDETSEREGRGL